MRASILRATVMAGTLLLGLVPGLGLAPALAARGDHGTPGGGSSTTGYDISWPQCGGAYPSKPAFGIVGVNGGLVYSANPCLSSEITWAGGKQAQLYANTGNPGPQYSTHWPVGQTSPRWCDPNNSDTADCAFDYGYNAAADSYATAVAAFQSLQLAGTPADLAWWLDVETGNSWRSDVSLNVAALNGAVSYLGTVAHVAGIGFYSTSYQWGVITGGTTVFASSPSWVAGASNAKVAGKQCGGPGFTGGRVTLVQYPSGGFDADLRC